jgi:hypothetical protein
VVVIDAQKLYTLNAVGTRVWELADGRSLEGIVSRIVDEFDVDLDTAREDLGSFVRRLRDLGALCVDEANAPKPATLLP